MNHLHFNNFGVQIYRFELQPKLLASPLITPIVVPYIIPYITLLRSLDYSSCTTMAHLAVFKLLRGTWIASQIDDQLPRTLTPDLRELQDKSQGKDLESPF